jgi:MtrB/PioB family decaheme-associated outer membrane protein
MIRVLLAAFCGAAATILVLPAAHAADGDSPTKPSSWIDLGFLGDSQLSPKFGDYTGLRDSGAYGIGDFDLRGGAKYDSDSTRRWRLTGSNLFLDSRNVRGEFGEQGKYRIKLAYDELPHYRSNTYGTPFLGADSSSLLLPSPWTTSNITTPLTPPQTPANIALSPGMTQLNGSMQGFQAGTKRTRYDSALSLSLGPRWTADVNYRHDTKDGTKLIGAAIGGLRGMLLPDPVSTNTDQIDAKLAFTSKKGQFHVGYYGSLFKNDVTTFSFQNPYVGGLATGAMGSPPDNQFNQWNAKGSYKLSPTTKLTGGLTYARATQNESFAAPFFGATPQQVAASVPASSLNGLLVTKVANLKLTAKPLKALNVAVAYKYDDRDNRSPQNTYLVATSPDNPSPVTVASVAARINPVVSKTTNQLNLDADYALTDSMWLKAGYDRQQIDRTETENDKTTENTYRVEYRLNASETVTGRIGYSYSARRGDYQQYAAYLATQTPAYVATTAWEAAGLTPFGTDGPYTTTGYIPQLSGTDILGLRRFFLADRNRDKVRSSISFQATEAFSVQAGLDYNRDTYENSLFGLQEAKSWAPLLDVTYAAGHNFAVSAFYTREDIRSIQDGRSWTGASATVPLGKIDPRRDWSADVNDKVDTVGLALDYMGLLSGKLGLDGNLVYSRGRTLIGVTGNSTATVLGVPNTFVAAQSLPDVSSKTVTLTLNGRYQVSDAVFIRLGYIYWDITSSDYALDGVAPTTLQSYLGPNESSPTNKVHLIGLSCSYRF